MKVGVFIPQFSPQAGGAFSFQESIIEELERFNGNHEIYVFHYSEKKEINNSKLRYIQIHITPKPGLIKRIRLKLLRTLKIPKRRAESEEGVLTSLSSAVDKFNIELMWFLTPAFENVNIPYIYTVWDLQHRLQPFFPEVSISGWTWSEREQLYSKVLPRAAYILTGTEEGRREIIQFYNIDSERIRVLPLPTPSFCFKVDDCNNIVSNFDSGIPFLFYPAQFWPHKNHICLLYSLKLLKEKYELHFNIILTGSDKGNLEYVKKMINELNLEDSVKIYGFVHFDELVRLYRSALALVFPSFFGPDNLPPLEAFALGCPVIASNVPGACDQLGDAAFLVDMRNEEDIAIAVKTLFDNKKVREEMIARGRKRALRWTATDYVKSINDIFNEFSKYRRCWSSSTKYIHL